jgi:hypothetical protein
MQDWGRNVPVRKMEAEAEAERKNVIVGQPKKKTKQQHVIK